MSGCAHDAAKCCSTCQEERSRAGFRKYLENRKKHEPIPAAMFDLRHRGERGVPRSDPRWGWGW